jgi:hypothetical protein
VSKGKLMARAWSRLSSVLVFRSVGPARAWREVRRRGVEVHFGCWMVVEEGVGEVVVAGGVAG